MQLGQRGLFLVSAHLSHTHYLPFSTQLLSRIRPPPPAFSSIQVSAAVSAAVTRESRLASLLGVDDKTAPPRTLF